MKNLLHTKTLLWLFLLALIAVSSACSLGKANAQRPVRETARTQPTESPTPGYKPLKRVSRDVIDSEKTEKSEKSEKKAESAKEKKKK